MREPQDVYKQQCQNQLGGEADIFVSKSREPLSLLTAQLVSAWRNHSGLYVYQTCLQINSSPLSVPPPPYFTVNPSAPSPPRFTNNYLHSCLLIPSSPTAFIIPTDSFLDKTTKRLPPSPCPHIPVLCCPQVSPPPHRRNFADIYFLLVYMYFQNLPVCFLAITAKREN